MSDFTGSRLGQALAAGDTSALFLKLWSGEVLAAFETQNVTQGRHRVRQIPHGKSAQFNS